MSADLSILQLVLDASLVVQLVMLILLAASLMSWALIFRKRGVLGEAQRGAETFEEQFWSGGNLTEMFGRMERTEGAQSAGMGRIFQAGFREFSRMRAQRVAPEFTVEAAHRAMRVTLSREQDELERYIPFLATVGSTSPYIGLFGTVWGIMNSFRALGQMQQATLATVAPGIAEALVATALGLFAAIPAVIAYNRYASWVERLTSRYEIFMEEFTSILQRHAYAPASGDAAVAGKR